MEILYEDTSPVNQDYVGYGHLLQVPSFQKEAGARYEQSKSLAPWDALNRMYDVTEAEMGGSRNLTPEEWKESDHFRPDLSFPDGVNEDVAKILADRKDAELIRQDVIGRAPKGLMRAGSMIAVDFAAQMIDPLNIASAFVPIVGEARFAAMTGKFGVTAARVVKGATEGAFGAAMVEPLVYMATQQEQADYDMYDSLQAVAYGAILGGGLHVGLGKLGDALGISPYVKRKAFESAVVDALEGNKIRAADVVEAGRPEEVVVPSERVREVTDKVVSKDTPKSFAARIASGENITSREDLQFQANNGKSIEAELIKLQKKSHEAFIDIEIRKLEVEYNAEARRLMDQWDHKLGKAEEEVGNLHTKRTALEEKMQDIQDIQDIAGELGGDLPDTVTAGFKKEFKDIDDALKVTNEKRDRLVNESKIDGEKLDKINEKLSDAKLRRFGYTEAELESLSEHDKDYIAGLLPEFRKLGYTDDEVKKIFHTIFFDPEFEGKNRKNVPEEVKKAIRSAEELGQETKAATWEALKKVEEPEAFTSNPREGDAITDGATTVEKNLDGLDNTVAKQADINEVDIQDIHKLATKETKLDYIKEINAIEREEVVFKEHIDEVIKC